MIIRRIGSITILVLALVSLHRGAATNGAVPISERDLLEGLKNPARG